MAPPRVPEVHRRFASCLAGPLLLLQHIANQRRATASRVTLSASDLVEQTGAPRTTIRRWLIALRAEGYLLIRVERSEMHMALSMLGNSVVAQQDSLSKNGQVAENGQPVNLEEKENPRIKTKSKDSSFEGPALASSQPESSERSPETKNGQGRKAELSARYDGEQRGVLRDAFARIDGARKHGHAAESVKVSVLERLDRYDVDDVIAGTHRFLQRDGIAGNPEAYWLGCVRGAKRDREAKEDGDQ